MDGNWILIGMMGAGKTSIGRALAGLSGRRHIDTDHLLQRRLGRPIPQLFKIYGESTFRDHETSILKGLEPCQAVVSTGGGIVLRPANWEQMRRLGTTIYIEADLVHLLARLGSSKKRRPLLQFDNWQERVAELLEQRRPLYEQADLTIKVGEMCVDDVARAIFDRMGGS